MHKAGNYYTKIYMQTNQEVLHTQKVVIETKFYGLKKTALSAASAREKIVTVDDEVGYKEWQRYPQFQHTGKTGMALHEFEKQLSFRQQGKPTKKRSSNRRNFVERIKFVWRKLFFKAINFKT
ncbi:MAG: hypothetical protein EAY75_00015 [Bacteroidetes bacterium]|nr:MAG: hypothetical protein EAY75_00015 [Bacteroidota bacterium]